MDPGSPSPFLKPSSLNHRGNDVAPFEEVPLNTLSRGQWDTGRNEEVEKPWASEKEIESVVDGVIPTAGTLPNHKAAGDKQRFNTLGYQKPKLKNSVVPDFATVSKGFPGSTKPRGTLRQVFSQAEKAPPPEYAQLESLKQALESFPLPPLPDWKGGGCGGDWGGEGGGGVTGVMLEESWTRIVHSHSTMTKTQRHQQEALWELIHTELSYIRKLTIVNDLVIAALVHLRKNGFLLEVTPELLFSNLPSVLQAHRLFWQEVLLPMVQEVRETGNPFDPMKLESACLEFSEHFAPYLQYCWEEERTVEFTRKQTANPLFQTFLEWVESCPLVCRMRLGDMQAKPHQRITKYPLILKAILKCTQDPVTQYSVRRMLTSVNSFLDSINEYLAFKADELALSQAAQRVEGFEVAEVLSEEIDKHVREFCRFDLTSPIRGLRPGDIRKLLMEDSLKIKEKRDSKVEVIVMLFSDMLLVTKAQRKSEKLKVVRPPLALERTHCASLKDSCSFVLVEKSELGCAVNVYTILTPSTESCSSWVSAILKAQESLAARRERELSDRLGEFRQVAIEIEKQVLPPSDADMFIEEKEEQVNQPEVQSGQIFSEQKPENETSKKLSPNGSFLLTKVEKVQQNQLKNSLLAGRNLQISQSARGNFARGQNKGHSSLSGKTGVAWSKEEAKENSGSTQVEFTENTLYGVNERRVTWNHTKAKPYSSNPIRSDSPSFSLLDKQQNPEITHRKSASSPAMSHGEEFSIDTSARESASHKRSLQGEFTRKDSEAQSTDQHSGRDSDSSQSGEDGSNKPRRFSRKLNSPRLQRRRPVVAQHNAFLNRSRNGSFDSGDSVFTCKADSSSNSDADCNQRPTRTASQPPQKSHSYLGVDLRSMRGNRGVLQNGAAQMGSTEPGAVSEPEPSITTPEQSSRKRPKFRAQRSASIPDITLTGSEGDISQSSQSDEANQAHILYLEGLLVRARERAGETGKAEGVRTRNTFSDLTASRSQSTSSSPSPSETNVEFLRADTPTVTHGGGAEKDKEEESDRERKISSSLPYPDGASVDWLGWCVDDNEVMVLLVPEDIEDKVVASDGQCSEV